jgi:hypothetical protein
MFTYIIWGILALLLFIFKDRVAGFFVVGIVFLVMSFLAIFILDFYSTLDPNNQGVLNLSFYNKTVEDPAEAASDLGEMIVTGGNVVNDKISETGSTLDEQFGIVQDDTGKWVSVADSSENDEESSAITTNETNETEKEETTENTEATVTTSEVKVTYSELSSVLSSLGLSREDEQILKSLSPYNLGSVKGAGFEATNTESTISIKLLTN